MGNPFGFQGRRHFALDTLANATDGQLMLVDYRNRFSDPVIGRWLTRDPIGYADSFNLYQQMLSNPLRFRDPTGLRFYLDESRNRCGPVIAGYGCNRWTGKDTPLVVIGETDPKHPGYVIIHTSKGDRTVSYQRISDYAKEWGAPTDEQGWKDWAEDKGTNGLPMTEIHNFVDWYHAAWDAMDEEWDPVQEAFISEAGEKAEDLVDQLMLFYLMEPLDLAQNVRVLADWQAFRSTASDADVFEEVVTALRSEGNCFTAGTLVLTATGYVPIEDICVGDRVLADGATGNADENARTESIDPATWRLISLELSDSEHPGAVAEIRMLRPESWITPVNVAVGAEFPLSMPGMELAGNARILAIEPCPAIDSGEGRVVTLTIARLSDDVMQLGLEGLARPLEPTGGHRFYSETANDWVPACKLSLGDELRSSGGSVRITSLARKPGMHRVYNLEVQVDHCYHVSEFGVLCHNDCEGEARFAIEQLDKAAGGSYLRAVGEGTGVFVQSGKNSRALGENLAAAGMPKPGAGFSAHHIAAGTAEKADDARKILTKFKIDINAADNGVWLDQAKVHQYLHDRTYYDAVNNALKEAKSRQQAIDILESIRQDLQNYGCYPPAAK